MKVAGSISAIIGMLFSLLGCAPVKNKRYSVLKDSDNFYDYSLSFDSLLNSSYLENPTVLKPIENAAKENIERNRAESEWFIVDSDVKLIKMNNGDLSVGSGDIKLEKRGPTDFTPVLKGDGKGNSKGWPKDPKENSEEETVPLNDMRRQLEYAVQSTLDFLKQSQVDYDRDRVRESQAREAEQVARAIESEQYAVRINTEWQQKMQRDQEELVSSIQADALRRNQEAANVQLILLMVAAPIDASEKLSKDLEASRSQAEANLSIQLANDQSDLIRQKRKDAASDLEKAVRESESIATKISESSKSNVTPVIKSDGFQTSGRTFEGDSVRDAAVYVGIAKTRVESAPAGENKEAARKILIQSEETLRYSDGALASGDLDNGNAGLEITYALADAAVALAPLVIAIAAPAALPLLAAATAISFAKDFYEAKTGRNLFSGKELNKLERGFAVFGVIAVFPIMKAGKAVGSLANTAADAAKVLVAGKKDADLAEAVAAALRAEQIAVDAAVRAGINSEKSAAAFAKAANSLRASGFEGDVTKAVKTISHWNAEGGTSALAHVLSGDFHKTFLTGGMHTFQGLRNFFSLNPTAQAAMKVEVASNGVGRVMVPFNYLSARAANGAQTVVKTLFPETWTAQKIIDAVDSIASKTLMKEETFINEMVVDGVNIRVVFDKGLIKTAFPIFPP